MTNADTGKHFDTIVLGVGGMGSAACYHLARRGQRVLGLERFDVAHAMGSSHGITRIIRLAYYEDTRYVPLLRRAYELWRELETGFGEQLLHITGAVDASPPGTELFAGSLASCLEHDLPYEILTNRELQNRYPAYHFPADLEILLQPDGGYLMAERCTVAHVTAAQAAGAEIHAREKVLSWDATVSGVRVETDRATYEAENLVIAAGAWMGQLVPELANISRPERQVLAWLQPSNLDIFAPERFPVFNIIVEEGRYYGFPIQSVPGFKFGRYHHLNELVDPDTMDREPNAADEAILREFAARYFPDGNGPAMALRTCIFTNTPDEHFIIDRHPTYPQVVLASPCSGHGYKFCSLVGEVLADLTITGQTAHNISLFRYDRFAS